MSLALSWSGGKDCMLALGALRDDGVEPAALVSTVTEGTGRLSMHAVPVELVRRQAAAVGVPLVEVTLPDPCPDAVYAERMATALAAAPLDEVGTFAFGDLYLEDVRAFREARLAEAGRRAAFPLWGRPTDALARGFVAAGFVATLVSVDCTQVDASLCGRAYDDVLLDGLPPTADPCGENGEFHTFVHAGPLLAEPVPVRVAGVEREGDFARARLEAA